MVATRAAVDRPGPGHVVAPLLTRTEEGQGQGGGERVELHGQGPEDSSSPAGALQLVRRRARRRAACQLGRAAEAAGADPAAHRGAAPVQVIDVTKITSTDVIPQRAVLRVPQMAEQLVDEPVPSFDDFELVEEEEENEHPQVVPGSRVRDAHGRSWCRVVGPAGLYWWMIGTSTAQYTSPEGITARPGR